MLAIGGLALSGLGLHDVDDADWAAVIDRLVDALAPTDAPSDIPSHPIEPSDAGYPADAQEDP
jgi:hypothetical protein